VFAADKVIDVL